MAKICFFYLHMHLQLYLSLPRRDKKLKRRVETESQWREFVFVVTYAFAIVFVFAKEGQKVTKKEWRLSPSGEYREQIPETKETPSSLLINKSDEKNIPKAITYFERTKSFFCYVVVLG